jgi:hypothetical protein
MTMNISGDFGTHQFILFMGIFSLTRIQFQILTFRTVSGQNLLSAADRCFAPVGGCLYQKQLDLFWQKLKIIRKKGKFTFKIVVIDQVSVFLLHR